SCFRTRSAAPRRRRARGRRRARTDARPRTERPTTPRDPSDGAASSERLVGGSVRVRSSHDVVQACDLARETARKLEFSLLDQTKIATAASELARNILLYAGDGEVRILKVESPRGLQITAI